MLSGFELYPRWVPLKREAKTTFKTQQTILIYTEVRIYSDPPSKVLKFNRQSTLKATSPLRPSYCNLRLGPILAVLIHSLNVIYKAKRK